MSGNDGDTPMLGTDELNEGNQIRISLVLDPSVPSKETPDGEPLEVPSDPIAVPSNLRRRGLSAIVNHLLDRRVEKDRDGSDDSEESDDDSDDEDKLPSLPFDFLVNGRLLRTGVEAAARRDGLSLETALKVHYFPAAKAPTGQGESEAMPDWITSMSSTASPKTGGSILITGCADGTLKAFDCSGGDVSDVDDIGAHTGPIKCIASLSNKKQIMIASGSIDQTLLMHVMDDTEQKLALHSVFSGGHSSSVCSVAMTRQGNNDVILASGDWNGGLSVWKAPNANSSSSSSGGEKASKKKQKTSNASSSAIEVEEVDPLASWKVHASNVSGIVYTHGSNGTKLITGSWDHSLKVHDIERQDCILTLNGSRVVTAIGRCHNSDVVASAHPDCTVRLWDMRVNAKGGGAGSTSVSDTTLKPSHKSWVSAVQWSPTDPYVLATTSHDGTMKVWDIRSSLPLHTVRAHPKGEKGLCIAYTDGVIYTGGSDCVVKRFVC